MREGMCIQNKVRPRGKSPHKTQIEIKQKKSRLLD